MTPLGFGKVTLAPEISYQTLVRIGKLIGSKGSLSICMYKRHLAMFDLSILGIFEFKKLSRAKSRLKVLQRMLIPL
jgi:hypothetical protein